MKNNAAHSLKILAAMMAFDVTDVAASYPDLTGSDAKHLQAYLGKVVSLRGNLSPEAIPGICVVETRLAGALSKKLDLFVTTDKESPDSNPWVKLQAHEVRVTGKLCFQPVSRYQIKLMRGLGDILQKDYFHMVFHPFPQRVNFTPLGSLSDSQREYYYMAMGTTKLEAIRPLQNGGTR